MIVATMKNEWARRATTRPAFESAQLARPYWVSKIHCQITVAVSAGIAQARISDVATSSRIFLPSAFSSSAISMPSTIVRATLTAQKIRVRHSTVQN